MNEHELVSDPLFQINLMVRVERRHESAAIQPILNLDDDE